MRKILTAVLLSTIALPASAATIVDTGIGNTNARPVNSTTTLLGQFSLSQATQIQSIETYGRIVSGGQAFYGIYSSIGNAPGALLYSSTASFAKTLAVGYTGISNLAFNLLAGTYFVAFGQASSSFSAYVLGGAPNPLGLEGSFKPSGYIPTNSVDLSWRISGASIAADVPEPATWALMIGGMGLVGGAMRYRRGKRTVTFA